MSRHSIEDRTLAFAGILQALRLVQLSAHGKPCDLSGLRASLESILRLEADSVEAVYGGISGMTSGLSLVLAQLVGRGQRPDPELARYLVTLLHLERKLSVRDDLLDRLRAGIKGIQEQINSLDITHDEILSRLAGLYSTTVSTLSPRILVKGDKQRLQDPAIANRVRALLLAAMRSAVLWRQCGGSRLGLIVGRGRMIEVARRLMPSAH